MVMSRGLEFSLIFLSLERGVDFSRSEAPVAALCDRFWVGDFEWVVWSVV